MDLGLIVDSKLSFTDHITLKVNKAYSILSIIKRNFQHVDKDAFICFIVLSVGPVSFGICQHSLVSL